MYFILRLISQKESNWFQSSGLIIQLSVRIGVMTNGMHDLPFIMSEASENKKVCVDVVLVMDEVVADSHDAN